MHHKILYRKSFSDLDLLVKVTDQHIRFSFLSGEIFKTIQITSITLQHLEWVIFGLYFKVTCAILGFSIVDDNPSDKAYLFPDGGMIL